MGFGLRPEDGDGTEALTLLYTFLGELVLEVPDFIKLEQDATTQTASVSVEDSSVGEQKEMWGMFAPYPALFYYFFIWKYVRVWDGN